MFLGTVRTVTTVDGSQQRIHMLDSDEVIVYNNDTYATVQRDGVVMNVTVLQICDGDKILTFVPANEFAEPKLF